MSTLHFIQQGTEITNIKAREILDSRGHPMVEVEVWTADGSMGRGSSPCGTSVGRHEAFVLRDNTNRFGGLGVQKAVANVREVISPAIVGKSVLDQRAIDDCMNELDGTPDKSNLGANAIYSTSIAVARAAANSLGVPLYRYLGGVYANTLPMPMFNVINGGPYSNTNVDFQEFLLIPTGAKSYAEALRMGVEVFSLLDKIIKKRYGEKSLCIGHLGGYAAPVNEPSEILEILLEAVEAGGYKGMFKLGLDCAATHFYDRENNFYNFKSRQISREEMLYFFQNLVKSYPVVMIEDPFHEDDFEGYAKITTQLDILIAGDDLFATNIERLKKGVDLGAANALIFKPNMVGTISEAMETAYYAREHGYYIIPSGRAGGPADDPIPEIAVAINAHLMKVGAPRTAERIANQNCLLRIEEELGESARLSSLNF